MTLRRSPPYASNSMTEGYDSDQLSSANLQLASADRKRGVVKSCCHRIAGDQPQKSKTLAKTVPCRNDLGVVVCCCRVWAACGRRWCETETEQRVPDVMRRCGGDAGPHAFTLRHHAYNGLSLLLIVLDIPYNYCRWEAWPWEEWGALSSRTAKDGISKRPVSGSSDYCIDDRQPCRIDSRRMLAPGIVSIVSGPMINKSGSAALGAGRRPG
ncbi:hypothetical protein LIA77_03936 [Sarocladium implicatum]|nr:hypothetical protein LIA77_03936 [Sarocladium implicatum]